MSSARGIVGALMAALLSLTTTGCIRKVLLDGQLSGTKDGADAVNTLHDYEVARSVARAGIGQLEGLYRLAPYNEDGLLLLTKSWAGASYAFTQDEQEQAEEAKDDVTAAYHRDRTIAGFKRARFYASILMNKKAPGFDAAQKNTATMNEYLRRNFVRPDEAEDLTWMGFAFVGLVDAAKDHPEEVANLYIGVAIVERALELDEKVEHGMNHVVLGAYHARTAQSELDEAKQHFDAAMKINGGKFLSTQLNYGAKYYCAKSDRANYQKMLNAVLAAGDPLPDARLQNLIAKRRARRYLDNKVFQEDCGFID